MTPQPQPQEYITTIDNICEGCGCCHRYEGYEKRCCIISRVMSHPDPSPQNPCIEQGCTDIENCDEICEHSRIYSPAWLKNHDTTLRNATLDDFCKGFIRYVQEAQLDSWTDYEIIAAVERCKKAEESLRSTQPQDQKP